MEGNKRTEGRREERREGRQCAKMEERGEGEINGWLMEGNKTRNGWKLARKGGWREDRKKDERRKRKNWGMKEREGRRK